MPSPIPAASSGTPESEEGHYRRPQEDVAEGHKLVEHQEPALTQAVVAGRHPDGQGERVRLSRGPPWEQDFDPGAALI